MFSTTLILQAWQFDVWSALIGAVITLLLMGLAYRFRKDLRRGWKAVTSPLAQLQDALETGIEERYRADLVEWAASQHALAQVTALDELFVEARLLCPPPLPKSAAEAEILSPHTLPLSRILGGHSQLAILGPPGSGRTTLLTHLASVCARLDESNAYPEEIQQALPLYVPLTAMDWKAPINEPPPEEERGEKEDRKENEEKAKEKQDEEKQGPAKAERNVVEQLLEAATAPVNGGGRIKDLLRQEVESGHAIILIDGWDQLPAEERLLATQWISALIDEIPGNTWLIAAGTRGYAPLTEGGFVPLRLQRWENDQITTFARHLTEATVKIGEEMPLSPQKLALELRQDRHANPTPLTLALRALLYLSEQEIPQKRIELFDHVLDSMLTSQHSEADKAAWLRTTSRAALGQIALNLQQERRAVATREEILAAIEAALPPEGERPARANQRLFQALTEPGSLLRSLGSDRYAFAHPLWQAYLTARELVTADPEDLIERLDDPRWTEVLRFYAHFGDMKPLVAAWLKTPDDLFHTRLQTLSRWIAAAPEDAAWREKTMAILAQAMFKPGQLARTRCSLAEALAETDMDGLSYFFKQALQHKDADVRLAGVKGIGRVAEASDLPTLDAALEDEDQRVRKAAVRALATMDNKAAERRLESLLYEADETLRAVAAEAMARTRGQESASMLRELVKSDDMMARRAAIFGLAELGAKDVLVQMVREEKQWIVRSAAEVALEMLEEEETISGVEPQPQIDQAPWLISWAASRGEGLGTGEAARQTLWQVLQEGEVSARLAAAQLLTRVGRPEDVEPLQAALEDPDPDVARVAAEALEEINRRYELGVK